MIAPRIYVPLVILGYAVLLVATATVAISRAAAYPGSAWVLFVVPVTQAMLLVGVGVATDSWITRRAGGRTRSMPSLSMTRTVNLVAHSIAIAVSACLIAWMLYFNQPPHLILPFVMTIGFLAGYSLIYEYMGTRDVAR